MIKIEKTSKAFLGIRTMGVFAPLSYWKSKDDWGIGDMDVLLKVVEFAKKERISVLSMLPLNFPTHDNCPYANASAYISDPVYIGMNMISDIAGFENPEAAEIIASVIEEIWKLRKNKLSLNEQIRDLKYEVLKAVFKQFDADKHPREGVGKPEPLRFESSGYWSRRITQEHRLVYAFDNEEVTVIQCRHHYVKK